MLLWLAARRFSSATAELEGRDVSFRFASGFEGFRGRDCIAGDAVRPIIRTLSLKLKDGHVILAVRR